MSTPARRRLMQDFKKLQQDPPAGFSSAPTEDSILVWHAIIFGPQDTPFEDGTFNLVLEFTEDYPNKPPSVKFVSKMFHPNVYADGSICLDILQNRWSPAYDVSAILASIQSLLDEPNPTSPANTLAAQLYQENRREYEKRVNEIIVQSWLSFSDEPDKDDDSRKVVNDDVDFNAASSTSNNQEDQRHRTVSNTVPSSDGIVMAEHETNDDDDVDVNDDDNVEEEDGDFEEPTGTLTTGSETTTSTLHAQENLDENADTNRNNLTLSSSSSADTAR